jgi:hypothetical protein
VILNGALRERHRAPRERAIRLDADVHRVEMTVESYGVEATAKRPAIRSPGLPPVSASFNQPSDHQD